MNLTTDRITVVSGLPRSGTSMMMSMLVAGGLEPVIDNIRTADDDNPKGYFEFERVKQLEKDRAWLPGAQGKVVKIISALLKHLPPDHSYNIVFMQRKMEEVLASQKQMLIRRGEPTDRINDDKMAELFRKHLKDVESWLAAQPICRVLYINYNGVLENPASHVTTLNDFLGNALSAEAMLSVVDKALHRQRK